MSCKNKIQELRKKGYYIEVKPISILKKVQKDYSVIAKHFDEARKEAWPEFLELFKNTVRKTKKVRLLDLGCGNGRLLNFLKDKRIEYIGLDNNKTMLKLAKKHFGKAVFKYGDMLKIPFKEKSFDSIWCIAALHHLPNKELQIKALEEIKRTLKKNGTLAITVWNLWQPKYKKYIDVKNHTSFIPWKNAQGKIMAKRFYYTFTPIELKNLLKESGFYKIKTIKSKYNIAFACHEKS